LEAMQSSLYPDENDATWKQISPLLDEALSSLGEKDRAAVTLRFLEHKSLRQVSEAIGISEDAAQKRVTRAIDKLRALFLRHGKSISAAGLAGALASRGVEAAPEELVSTIAAEIAKGALGGSTVAPLVQAAAEALTRAKLRVLALRAASAALFVTLAIVALV